jgi:hypothetical protein
MSTDPLIQIKCINKMSKHIGKDIARSMNIPITELKEYIKPKEIKSIILQYSVPRDEKALINSMILKKILKEVNNWVLGVQLCKMASRGEIETSWDDEQNCMIFETTN